MAIAKKDQISESLSSMREALNSAMSSIDAFEEQYRLTIDKLVENREQADQCLGRLKEQLEKSVVTSQALISHYTDNKGEAQAQTNMLFALWNTPSRPEFGDGTAGSLHRDASVPTWHDSPEYQPTEEENDEDEVFDRLFPSFHKDGLKMCVESAPNIIGGGGGGDERQGPGQGYTRWDDLIQDTSARTVHRGIYQHGCGEELLSGSTRSEEQHYIPTIPGNISQDQAWEQVIRDWEQADPSRGLVCALKDWEKKWHRDRSKSTLYGSRKKIALEFIEVFERDKTRFCEMYPEHQRGVTALYGAILARQKAEGRVKARKSRKIRT
ncbi:hypothetical protein V5O48_006187 [Marasmius crinis-equi]|uniref:Transcription activator GCR1-like domain-containing protein n=1 Tax=Marasmius crinis-equi TaxID=585013 RepID=A0ABR3FK73_9AGAR